jgi:GNAT superfamily N-acetyltransferase
MQDEARPLILAAHAALVADGVIEPLSEQAGDVRLWLDCEIASLVENRFFDRLDPRAFTRELREQWEPRATSNGERLNDPHAHAWYTVPYWITEGGERLGTIGLSTTCMGATLVTISSLYVMPDRRGLGIAKRALRRARDAVCARGARGLRVPTHWSWQPAVRFYLGLGMWVANWKHTLVFGWRGDLPEHRVLVGEREARFEIVRDGRAVHLITASRDGDRLAWRESPRMKELLRDDISIYHLGVGTFALALAVHGFPLVRSAAHWGRRRESSDLGYPEGLAYKIEIFEAIDRKNGFEIQAPRIPGLSYRDYDDID